MEGVEIEHTGLQGGFKCSGELKVLLVGRLGQRLVDRRISLPEDKLMSRAFLFLVN